MPDTKYRPVKRIRRSIPEQFSNQSGAAFTETMMILIGITMASIVVSFIFLGTSWFSADASSTNINNSPAAFKPATGAFTPMADLEANHDRNPQRVYSTVRGAIADLDNAGSENYTPVTSIIPK
jgi:hypothetical protein